MTKAERLLEAFHDHETFCRESLCIREKSGKTVDFVLQPAQKLLHDTIERCRVQRKPVRILFLKARQVMVSTGTAAEFFHSIPFHPGQRGMVIAHERKASENIFGYYEQLHDGYKPFRGVIGLPDLVSRDSGTMVYANGSQIEVATANNVASGRSASLRFLHCSEVAFYRDAAELLRGIMQCVPDDPDTMVVYETTANGKGGEFYRLWQEACDPSTGSEWIPLFFAWHQHPEYVRPIHDKAAFQNSLTREEVQLMERFALKLERIHWRRWAIVNKCGRSIDTFKQEYPSYAEEAFLSTGRPRFSLADLAAMPTIKESAVGELLEHQIGPKKSLIFQQAPEHDRRGALTLFRRPQPNKRYVIGVDVAEGIDPAAAKGGASDPDYSVANVFDRDTWEQVARIRGRIEPSPFAQYVSMVGQWFNWSFVVPEANGPGIAFLEGLLRTNYPPALIYHRRPDPSEQFSSNADNTLQMLGWKNNVATRVQLISAHDDAIRDRSIILHDPLTIAEHESFVIKPSGKAEHDDGCHDDEVIACALAGVGLRTPPPDERMLGLARPQPGQKTPIGVQDYSKRRLEGRGTILRPIRS